MLLNVKRLPPFVKVGCDKVQMKRMKLASFPVYTVV